MFERKTSYAVLAIFGKRLISKCVSLILCLLLLGANGVAIAQNPVAASQAAFANSILPNEVTRLENALAEGDKLAKLDQQKYREERQDGIRRIDNDINQKKLEVLRCRNRLSLAKTKDEKAAAQEELNRAEKWVSALTEQRAREVGAPEPPLSSYFITKPMLLDELKRARETLAKEQAQRALPATGSQPTPTSNSTTPTTSSPETSPVSSPAYQSDSASRTEVISAPSPAYPASRQTATTPDSQAKAADLPGSALANLLAGFPLTVTELPKTGKRSARNTSRLPAIDQTVWAAIEREARRLGEAGAGTVARADVEGLLTDVRGFLADQPDFFPGWVLQARLALVLDRAPEGISASINLNQLGVSGTAEPAVTRTVEQLGQRGW